MAYASLRRNAGDWTVEYGMVMSKQLSVVLQMMTFLRLKGSP